MSNRDVALEYVCAFCRGDISGVEATLGEEFTLKGPLFEFDSKSDYIASLRAGGLEPGKSEILGIADDNNSVAVFYSYKKASATMNVAQLFWFTDLRISKTLLVFDPGSV